MSYHHITIIHGSFESHSFSAQFLKLELR
jgi:hypothetical protein